MKAFVAASRKYTLFVEQRKNSASVFDQFANGKIVMVVDHLPFNPFLGVLLLFCTKGKLNEKLVQLFVYVIDAQLLESVYSEYFEPFKERKYQFQNAR